LKTLTSLVNIQVVVHWWNKQG